MKSLQNRQHIDKFNMKMRFNFNASNFKKKKFVHVNICFSVKKTNKISLTEGTIIALHNLIRFRVQND